MANLTNNEKNILLEIAGKSISYGLEHQVPLNITANDYSENLQEIGACFVTLEIGKNLRGCIGSLQAYRPLIIDAANNAFAAAFKDPRFNPVTSEEFTRISTHISVLTKPEPIEFTSENDLLSKIQPNIDGLILSDKGRQGTFLPSVWEQLPTKEIFLAHLKNKAGFPQDYWSPTIKVFRYHTEMID